MKIRKQRRAPRVGAFKPGPKRQGRRARPPGFIGPITGKGAGTEEAVSNPRLERIQKLLGYTRARRILRLEEEGVYGTLPELVVYDWLEEHGISFQFQTSMLGGIFEAGSALVDFAIDGIDPSGWYIWRVFGSYWHNRPENVERDKLQKLRLEGALLYGAPVLAVVDIWENTLYRDPEWVLNLALYGIEVPA